MGFPLGVGQCSAGGTHVNSADNSVYLSHIVLLLCHMLIFVSFIHSRSLYLAPALQVSYNACFGNVGLLQLD